MSEDLETRIARAIYDKNPALQPWDGDKFGFGEDHWAAKDRQKLARKQASAVMRLLASDEARPGTEDPEEGYRKLYERELARTRVLEEKLMNLAKWVIEAAEGIRGEES